MIGQYPHNIDLKRRLFIPSKFRISQKWVITAGLDKCLFLFPLKEWDIITEKFRELAITKKDARSFLRIFLSKASILSIDKQGRILIPNILIEYSELSRSCLIIGMINRLEIWNPKKWDTYSSAVQKNYENIAENIMDL